MWVGWYRGNPTSGLVHRCGCEFAQQIADPIWYDDIFHAYHDGLQDAACCLGAALDWEAIDENRREFYRSESCFCCGDDRIVERAHLIPRSRGGRLVMPLCPTCHRLYDRGEMSEEEINAINSNLHARFGDRAAIAHVWHGAARKRM